MKSRITEASQNCIETFEAWDSNKQSQSAKTNLLAALHELRRIAARVEIDIAHSESRGGPNFKGPQSKGTDNKKPQEPRKSQNKSEKTDEYEEE